MHRETKRRTTTRRIQRLRKELVNEVRSRILRRQDCGTKTPQADCDHASTQGAPHN